MSSVISQISVVLISSDEEDDDETFAQSEDPDYPNDWLSIGGSNIFVVGVYTILIIIIIISIHVLVNLISRCS